ncbi:hypothetical protein B0T22DRAFT_218843 [Podospora appendiculata]|uniref:Uncharacterized protein n=1 Tax=Podospora appendiculata TaxID=314037 RepID=A0AAE0X5T0_9PEZI|nr:hypothetical protein B0T22DRAFT_218843 [Podospora appendiculata]
MVERPLFRFVPCYNIHKTHEAQLKIRLAPATQAGGVFGQRWFASSRLLPQYGIRWTLLWPGDFSSASLRYTRQRCGFYSVASLTWSMAFRVIPPLVPTWYLERCFAFLTPTTPQPYFLHNDMQVTRQWRKKSTLRRRSTQPKYHPTCIHRGRLCLARGLFRITSENRRPPLRWRMVIHAASRQSQGSTTPRRLRQPNALQARVGIPYAYTAHPS